MNQFIFQIFDLSVNAPLIEWKYHLENIQKANGHYMLISPIQPHNDNFNEWFMNYQPLSYQLTEETRDNLYRLTQLANQYDVKIIVDVVWNHTSLEVYNDKTKYRYHSKNVLNQDPSNLKPDELQLYWLNSILPDLNTELDQIKEECKKAIETYRKNGVSGFRIDAGNFIDGKFFDYVFDSSPTDEIHLYEIFLDNYSNYVSWMIERIKNDKAQVIFYYFESLFSYINALNNFKENGQPIVQYFPPSVNLMTSILDHDIVLNISNYNLYDLYNYFCVFLYFHQNKYILYGIYNKQDSPNIFFWQRVLFNWENYFNTVQKIYNAKLASPKVMGILTSINNNSKGELPVIECSVGKNCKMLVNFSKNNESSVTGVPLKTVFKDSPYNLISLLTNLPLTDKDYNPLTEFIFAPPSSFSITQNLKDISSIPKIPLIFFWYQGIDDVPDFVSNAFQKWLEFSKVNNTEILFYDRKIIESILLPEEMEIVHILEEYVPVPQVYAAVSDYVRWVLIKYLKGGVYLDTDAYPTETSIYALNAFNEYDYLILGRESKFNVNNAIIIAPQARMDTIKDIINALEISIRENIFSINDLNLSLPDDGMGSYYSKKLGSKIGVWILLFTGPYFLSTYLYNNQDSNILVLNYTWFYFSYISSDKINGKNLSTFQHLYSGSWN